MTPPSPDIFEPNTIWSNPDWVLKEWLIIDELGKGKTSRVWSAVSVEGGCRRAIKFLVFPADLDKGEWIQASLSFTREGAWGQQYAQGELHLVQTYHCGVLGKVGGLESSLAILMDFHSRTLGSIFDELKKQNRKISVAIARLWTRQIAEALRNVHDEGFVHRDLTPRNILVDTGENNCARLDDWLRYGRLKLGDFGLTCKEGEGERSRTIGEDEYKAPELFGANANQIARFTEDVYSLGKVLREFAELTEGDIHWLTSFADDCLRAYPAHRPQRADGELIEDFVANWRNVRDIITAAGHEPGRYPGFVDARESIKSAFEEFAVDCEKKGIGGTFLIEGENGVGKSALLTHWKRRPDSAYFFERKFRESVNDMVRAVFEALCSNEIWFPSGDWRERHPKQSEPTHSALATLLRDEISPRIPILREHDPRVLIFIDALERADHLAQAAHVVKGPHPPGVFFVVSSLPRPDLRDILSGEAFRAYPIDPASDQNIAELTEYISRSLQLPPDSPPARELALAAGGYFEIAMIETAEIKARRTTLPDAIRRSQTRDAHGNGDQAPDARIGPDRLNNWLRKVWHELLAGQTDERRERLNDLITLLAVADESHPVPAGMILDVLQWRPNVLQETLRPVSSAFVTRQNLDRARAQAGQRTYQLAPRAYRFFIDPDNETNVGAGLRTMQARFAHWLLAEQRRPDGPRTEHRDFCAKFLVHHLMQAGDEPGMLTAARGCLTDLRYLSARLRLAE